MSTTNNPMRDYRGRFAKGHAPIIRPKYVHKQKFPKLFCNTCFMSATCNDYKKDCVCEHIKRFKKYGLRDVKTIINYMNKELDYYETIFNIKCIREVLDGGKIDRTTFRFSKNFVYTAWWLLRLLIEVDKSKTLIVNPISQELLDEAVQQARFEAIRKAQNPHT